MTLQKIAIIGAGGFAREVLDILDAINAIQPQYDVLGYIVETGYGTPGMRINDKPILGDFDWFKEHVDTHVICGVNAPEIKYKLIEYSRQLNLSFCSVIHPSVISTRWIDIGEDVVIAAGCTLSNQIKIGSHVHINPSCTIGHDVQLEDFVSLAPGVLVSGNVHLKQGVYIGTGAQIIQKLRIGNWSIIGAGSTIIRDVPSNTTVVGVPGRVIKTRTEGWHLQ